MASELGEDAPGRSDDSDRTDSDREIHSKVQDQANGHREPTEQQQEESGTDTDEEGHRPVKSTFLPKAYQRPAPSKRPPGRKTARLCLFLEPVTCKQEICNPTCNLRPVIVENSLHIWQKLCALRTAIPILGQISLLRRLSKPLNIRYAGRTRPGVGINLRDLLDESILSAGEDVLSVEYKGSITYATLTSEGHILCQLAGLDQKFESPSAFSIALKRLVNPQRKADDGWKTVKYNGRFLDVYKRELARRRLADMGDEDEDLSLDAPPRKRSKLSNHSDTGSRPSTPVSTETIPRAGAVVVGSNVEDESHMIPCERFRGEPCSASGSQPFRVVVSPGAGLLMDFHAHLSDNEVIGLLAGSWNPTDRLLRVERAYPVQEVQSRENAPTVEMSAADEKAAKLRMANKNNRFICVGWYHSHPQAGTHPSTLDIREQMKQQKVYRSLVTGHEPYIGAVVSPYREPTPDSRAHINYFHVDYPKNKDIPAEADPIAEGCLPMSLEVEEEEGPSTESYISSMPNNDLRSIAHRCANISRRVDIQELWQGDTKLGKLKKAVTSRLPKTWGSRKVEEYGTKVEAIVTAAWRIFGQPVQTPQGVKAEKVKRIKGEEEELDISDVSTGNATDSTQWN